MQSPIVSTKLQQIAEQAVKNQTRYSPTSCICDVDFLRRPTRDAQGCSARAGRGDCPAVRRETGRKPASLVQRMRQGQYLAPAVKRICLRRKMGRSVPSRSLSLKIRWCNERSVCCWERCTRNISMTSPTLPARSNPHQALQKLWEECMKWNIADHHADVSGFFDSLTITSCKTSSSSGE